MWRDWSVALSILMLAGCVTPLPPTPQDLQAKKFETVPGKSVIYVVRPDPDFSDAPAAISLDDVATITTYPGTYYRWEAEPGQRLIQGFAGHMGRISFPTEAGRLYFVEQRVSGLLRFAESRFALIPEPHGRAAVSRAELVPR
jgi:hypothetical protein